MSNVLSELLTFFKNEDTFLEIIKKLFVFIASSDIMNQTELKQKLND